MIDIINGKFGSLTVIGTDHIKRIKGKNAYFMACICECGEIEIIRKDYLLSGQKIKCFRCSNKASVKRSEIINNFNHIELLYKSILDRCYNKASMDYKYYGDKKVTMWHEWIFDKSNFYDWCRNSGYNHPMQLKRRNPRGNYDPCNCYFE